MTILSGKIVLITGANGGFGQEMIRQLLLKGSHLVLTDLDKIDLEKTAVAIQHALPQHNGQLLGCVGSDLSTLTGARSLYEEVLTIVPHVDVLINNAGIALSGLFHDIPQDKWETLMQVNILAPMRLTHHFLPQMVQRRIGHIVNVSSVAGLTGPKRLNSYAVSKFGLRGLSESLHQEYKTLGVRVTAVYPFFARTPIIHAPQFGAKQQEIPDYALYTPEFVVSELVKGIEQNRLHVYPGAISKFINLLRRFTPFVADLINGGLERQTKTS